MSSTSHSGAVVALAGRRIDPEPTLTARFPFDQVDRVRIRITAQLRRSHAVALVSSAACGADLVALETAQRMRLRTRIILPFSTTRFRENSVVDRPRPEFGETYLIAWQALLAHTAISSNLTWWKLTTPIQP